MESRRTDSPMTPLTLDPEFDFVYIDEDNNEPSDTTVEIVIEEEG